MVIVTPIASPAIALKAPRSSTAVAKTAQTRKKVKMISSTRARETGKPCATCGTAPRMGGFFKSQRVIPAGTGATAQRAHGRTAGQTHAGGAGAPRLDPARGEEAGCDRRVEVPARDVAEVRDHDPDRKAVGERHGDDVLPTDDSRAAADEDQREGADE